ncbi:hypothetical protein [Porphyromonas pogonae]|uniref:hypothetical protein n=1 Tax=Porphyromonas pogonae TaxID=867595 RepID=UPI002E76E749|nr:hypothetical protein [Porphyromonas pogonae]
MNKKVLRFFTLALLSAMMVVGFASCEKDPVTASNEVIHKDHEDPVKAVILLVDGHLHGTYSFHQNPDVEGVKYLKRKQQITFNLTKEGWKIADDSPKKFLVRSVGKNAIGGQVYGLWIYYYNVKGELMNSQFVENGQDKIHQHFFIPRNVEPTFDGVKEVTDNDAKSLYKYMYCDTTPWDKTMHSGEGKLSGDKNPIGFKGYFTFLKTRKQFNMNIELMHAAKSKFDEHGKTSPFYEPSKAQRQRDLWDLKISIPVIVYANQLESINDAEPTTPEKDIPADEMKLLQSIAHAYGITWKDALNDIYAIITGDVDPESGQLWF